MQEEIEIRVIVKDYKTVESVLQQKTSFKWEKSQKDVYYAPKEKDFYSYKPEYLRVRHQEWKNTITYWYCHVKDWELIKIDEYETTVGNPDTIADILTKLHYNQQATVTKNRKSFSYKNFDLELDFIEELWTFLEVEITSHNATYEEAKQSCYDILDELWIHRKEKADHTWYIDMIIEKKK